jgi:sialidase-1
VTKKGTIIVSWFTSLAFDEKKYQTPYPEDLIKTWRRHSEKLSQETRKQWLGSWIRRSVDNGKTWDDPIKVHGSAPHGPVELSDGRLLYAGISYWDDVPAISVEESKDDGVSWKPIGIIPIPPGDDMKYYHEPHAVEVEKGKIVVLIRYEKDYVMMQSESADGGKTWTVAHSAGIWGCPPHLLKVRDGRIIVVYGYRKEPFSERACISNDNGKTWQIDSEIILNGAINGDLGYPASVELGDGSIFTVYYQIEKTGEKTCLMGTKWKLK